MGPNNKKLNGTSTSNSNYGEDGTKQIFSSSSGENNNFPSSFSGLWKYPSGREVPFRNAYQWIESKRKDDNIGNLWRVYDKLYDLEKFIEKHPGGSEWIRVTRGTDITEAFETSHVVNVANVERILEKFFVSETNVPRISPYTFNENGFYKTLKRRVEPILKEVGTGPTLTVKLFQDFLVILFVLLTIAGTVYDSLALQTLAGLNLCLATICAHNFFHVKDNSRKYYYDLSLFSSHEWRISHALSHHLYTNTLLDYEISMLEPMLQMLPKRKRNFAQKYGAHFYVHFLYFGNMGMDLLKRILRLSTGKQTLRPENLIIFVELLILCWFAKSYFVAVKSWILIQCVGSYVFAFIGLMAAHHHPVCFHDGDEARQDPDFGLCQLDATKDRAEDFTKNLFFVVTTFGDHPLHHLFPTVCHSKLHHLKAAFQETLTEFSESTVALTQLQFLVGTYQQFVRESPAKVNQPSSSGQKSMNVKRK